MTKADDLFARYERMARRKQLYEPLLQKCAEMILPHRAVIGQTITEGQDKSGNVFDSTAVHANALLAARMHGALFSPTAKNFEMATRDSALNQRIEVRQWFEAAANAMHLAINLSNFHTTAHEACLEVPALGTAAQYCEERLPTTPGFNGLAFRSFALAEFVIDENADGEVDTLFRTFTLSARAAKAKWPEGLSKETQQAAEKEPEKLVEFLHCIYPRMGGKNPQVLADGTLEAILSSERPYASVYLEKGNKTLVEEGGYHECPFGCIRWALTPGEVYGTGVGAAALGDIKTLNKSVELFLKQWELAIQPPILTTVNNIIGTFKWIPGAPNLVRRLDAFKEWVTQARFDVTMAGIENLRKSVRDMFFSAQLELKQSPEMSATEVAARMQLMSQFLGPVSGRFMSDWLTKILVRVFGILSRIPKQYSVFPPMPPALVAYTRAQGEYEFRYLTPMARQQRQPEVQAIERYLQFLTAVQPMHPDALDRIDFDKMETEYGDITGVPPSIVRSDEMVQSIRDAKKAAREQAAQMQQMQMIAESAGKASGMVKALQPQNGGA